MKLLIIDSDRIVVIAIDVVCGAFRSVEAWKFRSIGNLFPLQAVRSFRCER